MEEKKKVLTFFKPGEEKEWLEKFQKMLQQMLEEFESMDDDDILEKGKLKYKIFERFGTDKKCPHCGSQLLMSDIPGYSYLCFECDENIYDFEAV